ncbi:MAG: hypothetical protein GY761_07930, partial [Hyphomicrobiales bacterium]|nr:hypothetical protein [Hyphomicrobiales bacterium]
MSIERCINSALAQGALDNATAQELLDLYRQQLEFEKLHGAGAEWRAGQTLADEIDFEAMERKRKAGLAARAAKARVSEIESYRNAKGEQDVGEGLVQLLEGFRSGYESVDGLRKTIIAEGMWRMDKVIEKFDRSKIKGT